MLNAARYERERGIRGDSVPISFRREIEILQAASVNSLLIRPEAP